VVELKDEDRTVIDSIAGIKQLERDDNVINISYELNGILFVKKLIYESPTVAENDFHYIEGLATACQHTTELLLEERFN